MNQPQPLAQAPATSYVKEGTAATFMADVVQASQQVPVIVDFWAPWCGPCKTLGPILEKAVNEAGGAVRMVKVNIDESPQVAQALRVQSIPAVFLFVGGQPADGFVGMVPEKEIKAFVAKAVKFAQPMDAPNADNLKSMQGQAEGFSLEGKHDHAAALYQEMLGVDPAYAPAHIGYIRALLALGDLPQAKEMAEAADDTIRADKGWAAIEQAIALAEKAGTAGPSAAFKAKLDANANDHQARQDYALALYAEGAREEAVDQLLEIIRRDRKWNEESARKELVQLFDALGFTDPIAIAGRRKLSSILFK